MMNGVRIAASGFYKPAHVPLGLRFGVESCPSLEHRRFVAMGADVGVDGHVMQMRLAQAWYVL
jgi:hypothetical protein